MDFDRKRFEGLLPPQVPLEPPEEPRELPPKAAGASVEEMCDI